jgi:hypothetical protein
MRAKLRVDGDPLHHLVVVLSERVWRHEVSVGKRPPAEPVKERGLDPGPEGVWVERVPLGVKELLGGEPLCQEP